MRLLSSRNKCTVELQKTQQNKQKTAPTKTTTTKKQKRVLKFQSSFCKIFVLELNLKTRCAMLLTTNFVTDVFLWVFRNSLKKLALIMCLFFQSLCHYSQFTVKLSSWCNYFCTLPLIFFTSWSAFSLKA